MNGRIQGKVLAGFLAILGMASTGIFCPARAETPAEFYRGKTFIIVSNEPGGPPDLMSRTITPFLAKEIGAKIRVENRKTDEVMNYIYALEGEKASLTLSITALDAVIGNDILKAPGVRYESDKLNYVADIYPAVRLLQLSPKLPHKTLEELRRAKGLRGGGTSAKGAIAVATAVMFEILGLDGKVITGFKGKKDLILAMARGEVDCMCTSDSTAAQDEKAGYVVTLMTTSSKRSPVVPHVPTLTESGVKVPKQLQAAHKFVSTSGTAVTMPPGVPPERLEYLRAVLQRMSANPEVQKGMAKLTQNPTPFVPGAALQEEIREVKADKELAAKLDAIFKKYTALR